LITVTLKSGSIQLMTVNVSAGNVETHPVLEFVNENETLPGALALISPLLFIVAIALLVEVHTPPADGDTYDF
jgi:hypothetical protein